VKRAGRIGPGDVLRVVLPAAPSPLVLRRMKALVDDGLEQPIETALRLELLASEAHAHSHDMKEGLAAFEEKRTPRFVGR
ncbi:MAG TPA: enoyl-CoA hydratase/isomerase family protein, partial [Burkholderiaceae bacterium]|nr:enoyl-CoA hydratase/isomerase family protein [Burkholderiaceae bacterium]